MNRNHVRSRRVLWLALLLFPSGCSPSSEELAADAYRQRNAEKHEDIFNEAIVEYTEEIQKNPKDARYKARAYVSRGIAYAGKLEYDKAIADYNEALRLSPKFSSAYYNRGVAYEEMGEHEKAKADFAKVRP